MVSIKKLQKSWIVLIILITIFYAGFLIYSDVESIGELFYKINFWYIPLILCFRFGAIVLRALRQNFFLNSLGITIPKKFNLLLYIAGLAMIITPASSGSMIKSYILKNQFGTEYTKTLPLVITEKYHDVLAPLSIIAFILLFLNIFEARLVVLILSFFMLGIFLVARNQQVLKKIIHKLSEIKFFVKFHENFIEFYDSFHILSNKKVMGVGWLLGIVATFIDGIAIYLGFVALGVDFSYLDSFVTVYTANILGMISFIPGGFGVVETSLLGFLLKAGLVVSTASSVVLITRLTGVWFQIILGFIFQFKILKNIK